MTTHTSSNNGSFCLNLTRDVALWVSLLTIAILIVPVRASEFASLGDLQTGTSAWPPSSQPHDILTVPGGAYFAAFHPSYGVELWTTDGTEAGTELVIDLRPGPAGSAPQNLHYQHGGVYFTADDGEQGRELWFTGGTAETTHLVADLAPGRPSSQPRLLTSNSTHLYFVSSDPGVQLPYRRDYLWELAGPVAEPTLIRDPGTNVPISHLLRYGERLLTSEGDNLGILDPAFPQELEVLSNDSVSEAFVVDSLIVFTGDLDGLGMELYLSDGTPGGTQLLKDINPAEPWYATSSNPHDFAVWQGLLFFVADDGMHGDEIWVSDFTTEGTELLMDMVPGTDSAYPANLTTVSDGIAFAAYLYDSRELWWTNGSLINLVDVAFGSFSSSPASITAYANGVLFAADGNDGAGRELWFSNLHITGTERVADIYTEQPGSSDPREFTRVNGTTVFAASEESMGAELWTTDGSLNSAVPLGDLNPGPLGSTPYALTTTAAGDTVYFAATDGMTGLEVYTTDGSVLGTTLVADLAPDALSSKPAEFTEVAGEMFFVATVEDQQRSLFKTDGTPEGTILLRGDPSSPNEQPRELTRVEGLVYFLADDDGNGRFTISRSDGTEEGTEFLHGDSFESGDELTAYGGTVYFAAYDGGDGTELWYIQREEEYEEVRLAFDLWQGRDSSSPQYLTTLGDKLVFSAEDGVNGRELWAFQAAVPPAEPTATLLGDLNPGERGSCPDWLTVVGDKLYFTAFTEEHGRELWSTDGTPDNTQLVVDILPGSRSSAPAFLQPGPEPGSLVFTVYSEDNGFELWRTFGDADSTVRLSEVPSTGGGALMEEVTTLGRRLFVSVDDGTTGHEPWSLCWGQNDDWDCNTTVNLEDYLALADCLTGPAEVAGFVAPSVACQDAFDLDQDVDIDVHDVSAFLLGFDG
jgi:ELWxxDGT repeat protein